jgi:hypothetical protein
MGRMKEGKRGGPYGKNGKTTCGVSSREDFLFNVRSAHEFLWPARQKNDIKNDIKDCSS